jgi:hypothetical protein
MVAAFTGVAGLFFFAPATVALAFLGALWSCKFLKPSIRLRHP